MEKDPAPTRPYLRCALFGLAVGLSGAGSAFRTVALARTPTWYDRARRELLTACPNDSSNSHGAPFVALVAPGDKFDESDGSCRDILLCISQHR